ncbi:YsnF/AvaK domain-containing protein [Paenibacillus sp. GD4]|jgi:uncharacterized protein (TIGR02271 family)|uniref:YsnF/AvaK domain-containing protein n=1 Tax=Paenibacillus sp. GD4 TaxID=3068890 RepID=UPI002796587F|nr:YsnF/AvaK domain-containing protein [Paenibacillus sp. GD4]MDQ1910016.1 YsnF/AvaK domain-containing protein [Paenibacillus sp. GD4]
MADLFNIFDDEKKENREVRDEDREAAVQLRQEELDISKDRVQTGEVKLHKDVIAEQKTVHVPVSHEEVVIERRSFDAEASDEPIGREETIRIPVSEDRVHVDKHTVVTGEVAMHKRTVQETQAVTDTVRREEARVEVEGDSTVVEDVDAEEIR